MSNLRHQLTKVKMDMHHRFLAEGYDDRDAELHIDEMDLRPTDRYAFCEYLQVEYRWTETSHSITEH